MGKINSFEDLKKTQANLCKEASTLGIQVKVSMSTCGIASGAREVKTFFEDAFRKRNIQASVIQTGCMGYCYAEPTIEVKIPNRDAVVFGFVDVAKSDLIIENYIKKGETVDGIIPMNFKTVSEI